MTTEACIHHWVIETAVSRASIGECIKCGATKRFSNIVDHPDFNRLWATNRQEEAEDDRSNVF